MFSRKVSQGFMLLKLASIVLWLIVPTSVLRAQVKQSTGDPNRTTLSQEEIRLNQKIEEISNSQRELVQRLQSKDREVTDLQAKLDFTNTLLKAAATFLALFFAFGAGFSVFGWFRTEGRAKEAHSFALDMARKTEDRTARLFDFAIEGETVARGRATDVHQSFLKGSMDTLNLVNATLSLSKEASERAAKFIERKARATVEELDQESQALLASVPPQNIRALAEVPSIRSDLRSLAQKITGFEINRFILPDDIQLTPSCLFIKGMDFHLSQQFKDAIGNWRRVALSSGSNESLKSLAWYWIGYEQNNINEFPDAEQSFENALEHASGVRKYELQRILFETRFFNKKKYPTPTQIQPLKGLLEAIEKEGPSVEFDEQRSRIANSLGNVLNQTGRELKKLGQLDEAAVKFHQAKELYREVSDREKWAPFGFAEMLHELGELTEAQRIFREQVRTQAINESVQREEPRTKVLARTTELICCLRVPELRAEAASIRSLVLQDLGRVDSRLTVYSQMQRRNVEKVVFQADLDELWIAAMAES